MRTTVTSWDPVNDRPIERRFDGAVPVESLLYEARHRWEGHGHQNPSVEFTREDGSALSIGTDGTRSFLVWMNPLFESFQSAGSPVHGTRLVFDYNGSYSEAEPEDLVPLAHGIEAIHAFLLTGAPETPRVLFSPR